MNKAIIALGLIAAMLAGIPGAAQEKREFSSYGEMRTYLGELFGQKKYAEAAALLETALDRFPDNVLANTYNLALARLSWASPTRPPRPWRRAIAGGCFTGSGTSRPGRGIRSEARLASRPS